MSIPPYPGPYPEASSSDAVEGKPMRTRAPIKYVWPKRIAAILAGLSLVGGIGFGVKTLLHKKDTETTSQETVQAESRPPAMSGYGWSSSTPSTSRPRSWPARPVL